MSSYLIMPSRNLRNILDSITYLPLPAGHRLPLTIPHYIKQQAWIFTLVLYTPTIHSHHFQISLGIQNMMRRLKCGISRTKQGLSL